MKKLLCGAIAALAILMAAPAAQAGNFKFGPKVGANINTMKIDNSVLSSDNRCGFHVGAAAQFTVPIIGIGADVSVLYTQRSTKFTDETGTIEETSRYNYLSVPVHVMYKLSLPAVSHIIAPYVVTGPDFAFRLSKYIINDYQAKKYNVSWDFGLGLELIKHLQISATYSLGMNKAVSYIDIHGAEIKGNTNGWTVSAAWMF